MPIKKREKYARREDAILHALELEKQLLEKQGKPGVDSDCTNEKSSAGMKKRLVNCSESFGDDNGKLGNSNLHQVRGGLEAYHKDKFIGSPLSLQKAVDRNQLSGEDDHSEMGPRMRGLQDFGLRITPSKQKLSYSVASNGSRKTTADHHADALAGGGVPSMENATHTNGVEQTGATSRAKRSRFVYLTAEPSDSLDYSETSRSQIEMPASHFGLGNRLPHPGSLVEENSSGFTEDVESDSSETDSSESESDSSKTEPDMDEGTTLLSEWNALGRSKAQDHGSMSTEEHDGSAFLGDMSHHYLHDHVSANDSMSKWRLKGKRNIRNLTKRSLDASDRKGFIHGTHPEERGSGLRQRTLRQSLSVRRDDFDYSVDDNDDEDDDEEVDEREFGNQRVRLDNRYSSTSRAASRGRNSSGRNLDDWDDLTWEDQPSSWRGYWGVKGERFDPYFDAHQHFSGRPRSMLVNVDLKVQASYQKEPVPIVSLMSKLNGKAIIGHPIQIEALEYGSAETLLSTVDFGIEVNNENTALQPAWRTARRTANFRVPRPHLSSALDGDEVTNDLPCVDQERRPPLKKLNAGNFIHKANLERSNLPHIPRPPTDKKFLRKPLKKVSLSASQKTRTLSSIATEQTFSIKSIQDSDSIQMDGLLKSESSGPATVACIPVKLVFSRLLEKINRPPSKAASNAVLLNGDVDRS